MTTPLDFIATHAAPLCIALALLLVAAVLLRFRKIAIEEISAEKARRKADPRAKLDAAEAREEARPLFPRNPAPGIYVLDKATGEWRYMGKPWRTSVGWDMPRRPREMDDRDRLAMIRGGHNG